MVKRIFTSLLILFDNKQIVINIDIIFNLDMINTENIMEEIIEVCDNLGLHEYINTLPSKYVFGNIKIQFLAIKSAIASTMFST